MFSYQNKEEIYSSKNIRPRSDSARRYPHISHVIESSKGEPSGGLINFFVNWAGKIRNITPSIANK